MFIYILFSLPALLLAIIAQIWVKHAYNKASNIGSYSAMTGADVAKAILRQNGITDVKVEVTEGWLSDHYHPLEKALRLSPENYHGKSLAAIGVAAHEAGHALQHNQSYLPLYLRSALVPVTSFGSNFAYIIFIIGLILVNFVFIGKVLMLAGIVLFTLAFLFTLITLPVEFDASNRAIAILRQAGFLSEQELVPVKKVLTAAALTYLAAAAQALSLLLWAVTEYNRNDD
ncbi:MAG: peptidase membrane zinc metallopeptidase [bacterium]|nr:MAG: peptidase membrane zinc metallopeptidase [bacterium]